MFGDFAGYEGMGDGSESSKINVSLAELETALKMKGTVTGARTLNFMKVSLVYFSVSHQYFSRT